MPTQSLPAHALSSVAPSRTAVRRARVPATAGGVGWCMAGYLANSVGGVGPVLTTWFTAPLEGGNFATYNLHRMWLASMITVEFDASVWAHQSSKMSAPYVLGRHGNSL